MRTRRDPPANLCEYVRIQCEYSANTMRILRIWRKSDKSGAIPCKTVVIVVALVVVVVALVVVVVALVVVVVALVVVHVVAVVALVVVVVALVVVHVVVVALVVVVQPIANTCEYVRIRCECGANTVRIRVNMARIWCE